jgi:hypothetical protein
MFCSRMNNWDFPWITAQNFPQTYPVFCPACTRWSKLECGKFIFWICIVTICMFPQIGWNQTPLLSFEFFTSSARFQPKFSVIFQLTSDLALTYVHYHLASEPDGTSRRWFDDWDCGSKGNGSGSAEIEMWERDSRKKGASGRNGGHRWEKNLN